jgi:hypothetical protein
VFDTILIGGDKAEPTRHQLLPCLRFFERIKTLCDVGMLDIAIVDGMFGYQFFWLVNHPRVQESVLFLDGHFFPEIFALHSQLVQYRKRSGYQIPAVQNDLALPNHRRHVKVLKIERVFRGQRIVGRVRSILVDGHLRIRHFGECENKQRQHCNRRFHKRDFFSNRR